MQAVLFHCRLWAVALLAAAASVPAAAQAPPDGDAAAGRVAFTRLCAVCHAIEAGQNKIGPSLAGVFGRSASKASGFTYSPAMQQLDRTWDAAALDTYLTDPRRDVPGGRMLFVGIRDVKQRADIIAYLATLH